MGDLWGSNSSRYTMCFACSGTGRRSCSFCGGSGRHVTYAYGPRSTREISRTCLHCSGSGRAKCQRCRGSGSLKRPEMHGTDCFFVPPGEPAYRAPVPGRKQKIWSKHADVYRHIFQSRHFPKALESRLVRGLAHTDLLSLEAVDRVGQLHAEVERNLKQCRASANTSTHDTRICDDLDTVAGLLLELQKHCKEFQQSGI